VSIRDRWTVRDVMDVVDALDLREEVNREAVKAREANR